MVLGRITIDNRNRVSDCTGDCLGGWCSVFDRRMAEMIPKNSHMPDKYCPACGAIWVPDENWGAVATCECYRFSVPGSELKVRPVITVAAQKFMNCPFPPWDGDLK